MNKRNIYIFSLFAILLIIVTFVFYEIKYKPDADWEKSFDLQSEEPYGTKLFYEMSKDYYGKENVQLYAKDIYFENIVDSINQAYIYISNDYFNYAKQDSLLEFVKSGNTAIIISNNSYMSLEQDTIPSENNDEDSIYIYDREAIETDYLSDSSIMFQYFKAGDSTELYTYQHYVENFWEPRNNYFQYFAESTTDSIELLSVMQDSASFFGRVKLDSGLLYVHLIPELFSNVASRQSWYREHFLLVNEYLQCRSIILDHPFLTPKEYLNDINKSPLSYILEQPSLKWAYYIILSLLLLYLFVGGKRKFKAVPLIEKNENTSIEYINIQSELYKQQDQHEKLINQMRSNFYAWAKSRYFIERDDDNFIEKLSRKSKIKKDRIKRLLDKINNSKIDNISDDQLIVLNKQIESIKLKAK